MSRKIQEIEGIGPAYAEKLSLAGIVTSEQLLEACCNAKGRRTVSQSTGVREDQLLKWANMADLMRVSGIGRQFSELLEAAGVDTIKELRTRRADNLAAKMAQVNAQKKLTRAVPSVNAVTRWVDAAKSMEPLITH